jgi:hypothetical protein
MKVLTPSKKLFMDWIRSTYGYKNVRFVKDGVVDFILPDGSCVIVKRPIHDVIYFTRRQWDGLRDGDYVAVVTDTVLGMVKFRDIKNSKNVSLGGKNFIISVEGGEKLEIRIKCSPETYERFKKVMVSFKDEEEALNYLLDAYELCGTYRVKPRVY